MSSTDGQTPDPEETAPKDNQSATPEKGECQTKSDISADDSQAVMEEVISAANDPSESPKRSRLRQWSHRIFIGLCGLFVAVHVYGFLLIFMPVPITANMALNPDPLQRNLVSIEDVSPHLIHAIIAAEDSRFCDHRGIDWAAVEEALDDNAKSARRRGGSTISQQTAKNVFLWNGGGYVRKAAEAWFATFVDAVWGKRRVMEVYLNVAEWGDGIYGAERAARVRFGKSAAQLNRREAALLAAVLPSPNKWRVDPPGPYVQNRAATLEQRARVVENSGYAACIGPLGQGS